jgi:glycosyltransferase involved in cell wall biosynthesis
MRPLHVLTWHVHGNYLYYLSQANAEFYLPVKPDRANPYGGRGTTFPFGANVHEVPVEAIRDLRLDCVLFQSHRNYLEDQYEVLSEAQRRLPRIFLEHDPPRQHPTDTPHPVDDPDVLLVHVTPFNDLMWDSGRTPTRVIEHGVMVPEGVRYDGGIARGLVVVNHLKRRGRRLGADVFAGVRHEVPLHLVGMGSEEMGGLGEIPPPELAAFEARYRFFFNPIRYTSLGLAVLEAMMIGMPIIGLATTEMVTVVGNGVSGYLDTKVENLIAHMRELLSAPAEARRLGEGARRAALERFSIRRFARDWEETFALVAGKPEGTDWQTVLLPHQGVGKPGGTDCQSVPLAQSVGNSGRTDCQSVPCPQGVGGAP